MTQFGQHTKNLMFHYKSLFWERLILFKQKQFIIAVYIYFFSLPSYLIKTSESTNVHGVTNSGLG